MKKSHRKDGWKEPIDKDNVLNIVLNHLDNSSKGNNLQAKNSRISVCEEKNVDIVVKSKNGDKKAMSRP